ncbi:MAG: hypothetical protein JXA38_04085 [Methanosarcinaceae archaeon]|nr:hypothetical protein [Methanosarcinaceae archaeon]
MKMLKDIHGNVEMIHQTLIIGITLATLWIITLVVPPIFQLIPALAATMDTEGLYYFDVVAKFNTAIKAWYFFLILSTAVSFVHLGLLAIKKQRYTGGNEYESDF